MALFDTSKELKSINSAFAISFELDNIQSFLDDAARAHLIPVIGEETLDILLEAKKAGLAPKSPQKKLLHLVQKAVLGFAFGEYSTFGALQIQDAGISVLSRDSFRPASDAKVLELRKQSVRSGFEALEAVLLFLETHLVDFPSYAESNQRQNNRASFICSSAEFSKVCVAIHSSVFFQLKQELIKLENDTIYPLLGQSLFEELKKAHQKTSFTDKQQGLIQRVQRVIAPLALAETICYNGLLIDASGCFQSSVGEPLSPSAENRLQSAMFHLTSRGQAELVRLQKALEPVKNKAINCEQTSCSSQKSNVYFI
ncbi:MAG: hypothetical protein E6Q66_04660 [Pedobacter sp.]|nr:MAG: hypothetical protein E6Q66_04660 [Pedobacter sp.]